MQALRQPGAAAGPMRRPTAAAACSKRGLSAPCPAAAGLPRLGLLGGGLAQRKPQPQPSRLAAHIPRSLIDDPIAARPPKNPDPSLYNEGAMGWLA